MGCLRKRGRHVQVGLMLGDHSRRDTDGPGHRQRTRLLGSHGIQAHRYGALLAMAESGKLRPERLIGERISLEQSIGALMAMDTFRSLGVSVVTRFLA